MLSIKQRRDALLIKQAYRCLNDPGHLGKIFRTRLMDLKVVTGHTQNPLNTPASYKQLYNKYWLARVAHILQDNGHKISTQLDMATPQPTRSSRHHNLQFTATQPNTTQTHMGQ